MALIKKVAGKLFSPNAYKRLFNATYGIEAKKSVTGRSANMGIKSIPDSLVSKTNQMTNQMTRRTPNTMVDPRMINKLKMESSSYRTNQVRRTENAMKSKEIKSPPENMVNSINKDYAGPVRPGQQLMNVSQPVNHTLQDYPVFHSEYGGPVRPGQQLMNVDQPINHTMSGKVESMRRSKFSTLDNRKAAEFNKELMSSPEMGMLQEEAIGMNNVFDDNVAKGIGVKPAPREAKVGDGGSFDTDDLVLPQTPDMRFSQRGKDNAFVETGNIGNQGHGVGKKGIREMKTGSNQSSGSGDKSWWDNQVDKGIPQAVGGTIGLAYLVSSMSDRRGQQSNSELYGQRTPYR